MLTYAMSKSALNTLSHSLAKGLGARGITVNAVSPGIADVVAFIASDDARWITGQVIDATGGAKL